ncbi:MAG: hypothetical protein LBI28_03375 [Treponema sp.]|jgi:uncharacterized lipoprotein YehR (DUF1307 family)|nr:hypothetical protein [Treponema sp.]
MKKSKLALFSGIIFVLATVLLLSACGPNDNRTPYYGNWVLNSPDVNFDTTYAGDKIITENLTDKWEFTVTSLKWEEITNTNEATKKDYPSGYRISGVVSNIKNSAIYTVGTEFSVFSFIHKSNKRKMIELSSLSTDSTFDEYNKANR